MCTEGGEPQPLKPKRWWVTTVAGGPDGEPGFQDGPANEARFNAPVAITVPRTGARPTSMSQVPATNGYGC